jgi:hypothetical protein
MNKLDILQLSLLNDCIELRIMELEKPQGMEEVDNEYNIKTYKQILEVVQAEISSRLPY